MSAGQSPSASGLRERAGALLDLGRYQDALHLLGDAVAIELDDHTTYCLLARARLGLKQPAEAYSAALQAVAVAPDEEWGHRLVAVAMLQTPGPFAAAQAVGAARRSVELAPHQPEPYDVLALSASRAGDRGLAFWAANRQVELAPHRASAHLRMATVFLQSGNPYNATFALKNAAALDPHDFATYNELGRACLASGDRRGAVRWFGVAAATNPKDPVPIENLRTMMAYDRFPWVPTFRTVLLVFAIYLAAAPLSGLVRMTWYMHLPRAVRVELITQRPRGAELWLPWAFITLGLVIALPAALRGQAWTGDVWAAVTIGALLVVLNVMHLLVRSRWFWSFGRAQRR